MRQAPGFLLGAAAACVALFPARGAGVEQAGEAPLELRALVAAYAGYIALDGTNGIVWRDGTRMLFDDGIPKRNFEEFLDRASLKDQMAQPYPAFQRQTRPPAANFDPGRARHEPFFRKLYGDSAKAVGERLRRVPWLGKGGGALQVTTVNGVDALLERISGELEAKDPALREFLLPVGGGFHWRAIAGTRRLSPHAFGIAVDMNPAKGTYWRWGGSGERAPWEIVEVFERHGFIWGGRWAHVDSMHFEFRPELLLLAEWRRAGVAGNRAEDEPAQAPAPFGQIQTNQLKKLDSLMN